ncbi:MAG: hypothetical protein IPG69_15765 [Flavobacteriales bacterium]|nr:hypothetical protein [Flavobacteriales bacterium]
MKHFLPITALALLLGACEQDPTQSEQYKGLADQKFQTEVALAAKDSSLNAMFESFNRINENMRTIREKQGMLDDTTPGAEPSDDMEQRMASDLARIDELLAQNRDLISKLRKDAKANTGAIAALQKTLDEMERTVAEKDSEISGLKEQLLSANSSLATLMEMYRDKEQQATMQRDELNKALRDRHRQGTNGERDLDKRRRRGGHRGSEKTEHRRLEHRTLQAGGHHPDP